MAIAKENNVTVKAKVNVRTFTAKESRDGESRALSGKFYVQEPVYEELAQLCADPGSALKAMQATIDAAGRMELDTETVERVVTMKSAKAKKEVTSEGVILEKLALDVMRNGDVKVELYYKEPALKEIVVFYYDHLGGDVNIVIDKMQMELDL